MGVLRLNGKAYGGGIDVVEVTQAQYNALPESKLSDDILYVISDSVNGSDGYPPLIYSTEEREVGVWTNGKPLYQRTFISSGQITTTSRTIADLTDSNIDECVNIIPLFWEGMLVTTQMNNSDVRYNSSTKLLTTRTNQYTVDGGVIATIWYTKTTDTKGSGRWTTQGTLAQHYSTTERLIGTWIDGKPLYQKTIEVTNPTHGAWTQIISDNNINIIGYINEASYAITQAGEKSSIDFCVNSNLYGRSLIYNNEHSMQIEYYNPYGTLSKYIVTIQYTKTTD